MGVGDAYLGIKQLLTSRDSREKIAATVSFVNGNLRPVKSETDTGLSAWYKHNSLIYVSPSHACWSDEESARKVTKNRFGRVVKADIRNGFEGVHGAGDGDGDGEMAGDVAKMLKRYEREAGDYIKAKVSQWESFHAGERDPDETEDEEELASSGAVEGGLGIRGVDSDMGMGISMADPPMHSGRTLVS